MWRSIGALRARIPTSVLHAGSVSNCVAVRVHMFSSDASKQAQTMPNDAETTIFESEPSIASAYITMLPGESGSQLNFENRWSDKLQIFASQKEKVDIFAPSEDTIGAEIISGADVTFHLPAAADLNVDMWGDSLKQHRHAHTLNMTGKLESSCVIDLRNVNISKDEKVTYGDDRGPGHIITGEKYRGDTIKLLTDDFGSITIKELIESRHAVVTTGEFAAKKVIATKAEVRASRGSVKIAAAYCNDLQIHAAGGFPEVDIETLHGKASIIVPHDGQGHVAVDGITGAVEVDAPACTVTAHFDQMSGHSNIRAGGDVFITIIPPCICRFIFASTRGVIVSPGLSGLFRENRKRDQVAPSASLTQGELQRLIEQPWFVDGQLTVKQAAAPLSSITYDPDDPDASKHGAASLADSVKADGSGKIRMGAEVSGFYSNKPTSTNASISPIECVVESTGGFVRVEVVSWFEYLKRKTAARKAR